MHCEQDITSPGFFPTNPSIYLLFLYIINPIVSTQYVHDFVAIERNKVFDGLQFWVFKVLYPNKMGDFP